MDEKTIARFWTKVDKRGPDDCWTWHGAYAGQGKYGVMCVTRIRGHKRLEYGHRLSFEIHYGPVPDGLDVMHSCDNPPCVNPAHLSAGTRLANIRDCIRKGRASHHNPARGTRQHLARLTDADVVKARKMRAKGMIYQEVARHFGVAKSTIMAAIKGTTWSHVTSTSVAPTAH